MHRAIMTVLLAVLVETGAGMAFAEGGAATSAVSQARELISAAKYAEAEELLQTSAEAQKEADRSSSDYAATLDLLGVLYTTLAKYSQADACLLEAADICQRLPEKGGVRYAVVLTHRAKAVEVRADFAEAERLINESLSLLKDAKLDQSVEYAAALAVRADLEWDKGKFANARETYSRAIELFKASDALETAACAAAQNSLGRLLNRYFDPVKAEELIVAATATRQKLFGEEHPEYAGSLVTQAIFLQSHGKTAEAEPLLQQAQKIYINTLGEDHPDYAGVVNALANAYRDGRNYLEAEPQARRAVDICEKTLGPRHPSYAAAWNNLALVHMAEANYVDAERAFTKAVGLYDAIFDRGHPQRLRVRDNLAELYEAEGSHRRAMQILEQERNARQTSATADPGGYARWLVTMTEIQRKLQVLNAAERQKALSDSISVLGKALASLKTVPGAELERATMLEELARLNMAMATLSANEAAKKDASKNSRAIVGKGSTSLSLKTRDQCYLRADELLKEALKIRKDYRGENHPDYAAALESQAGLYQVEATVYPNQTAGFYRAAESNYVRVCKIREQRLGTQHPDYASALANLANIYRAQGKDSEEAAAAKYKQALQIMRKHLDTTAVSQSERQQLAITETARVYLDEYLSLMIGLNAPVDDLYAEVLVWKGAVSRRQQMMRKMRRALDRESPEIVALYKQLELAARQLAQLSHADLETDNEAAHGAELDKLSETVEHLQRNLAAKSAEFRREIESRTRTPDDIRLALPENVVLIDLLEYWHYPKVSGGQGVSPARRVNAFILSQGQPTKRVDLGPAPKLEAAVKNWLKVCYQDKRIPGEPGGQLRQLLWTPLEVHVANAETVLISPDGGTAWLPWGALPAKEPDKFLIEFQSIAMLPVPQMLPDMLAFDANSSNDSPTLLVAGDIDYGAAPGKMDVASRTRSAARGDNQKLSLGWQRLAASKAEVLQVADSFSTAYPNADVMSLRAQAPTEEAVRTGAPEHRYLHFATHGFFAPREVASTSRGTNAHARGPGERAALRDVSGFHPGLLSGIVLAGANRPTGLDEDDGILTALEIEQLDLSRVRLVTLSACQTGIGNTMSGEGLLGLQRAFQVAGASSVLASLWRVDDQQTARLMGAFYENLWLKKLSRTAALRQAQIDILNDEALRGMVFSTKQGDKQKRVPPYYWAAFVLSGDWR